MENQQQNSNDFEVENGLRQESGDFEYGEMREKELRVYNEDNKKDFSKLIFIILIIFGVVTLVYGFVSLTTNIYGSRFKGVDSSQVQDGRLMNDLLEMQNRDTDKDGLSDYDEEYVYQTSPYLPDTDSDGVGDKKEIDDGFDPLCPKGQDCRGVTTEQKENSGKTEDGLKDGSVNVDNGLPDEFKNELEKMTPEQIRQLLLESGQLTESQVEQIDDETLLKIFGEVLGQ
jgi:hypothetical protein